MRLFFAALPDHETRARIAAAAAALDPAVPVSPDDYHMTLAFVGEVPDAALAPLRQLGAAQRGRRFSVRFERYEHWPKPRVIVVAASDIDPVLENLWQALLSGLAAHRIAVTGTPQNLRPHVTIARKVSQAPVLPVLNAFVWSPRAFHLMQSSTSGAGSRYTVVDTWPLLDKSGER